MHTNVPREAPDVDMGYETRDLNLTGMRNVAIVFTIFAFGCFFVVAVWLHFYGPDMASNLNPKIAVPTPQLQTNITVRTDIQDFRQQETKLLSTPGTNPDGSQRIPIDQAMNLISQRGLPHVVSAVPAASPGNTIKQNALAPGQHAAPTILAPRTPVPQAPAGGGAPTP